MAPVAVPAATVAVIWVAEFAMNDAAAVPLKRRAVAPVKLVPVRMTTVPGNPPAGEKLLMVGVGTGAMLKLMLEMSKK